MKITQMDLVNGRLVETKVTTIDPKRCPHFIFAAEHYNEDGSCKCRDPNETVMAEWGYVWSEWNHVWETPW